MAHRALANPDIQIDARHTLCLRRSSRAVRDWPLGLMHGFGNRMQRLPSFTPLVFERYDGRQDSSVSLVPRRTFGSIGRVLATCHALRGAAAAKTRQPPQPVQSTCPENGTRQLPRSTLPIPDSRERICSMMQKHGGSH